VRTSAQVDTISRILLWNVTGRKVKKPA
jgi:hypothetical protein